MRVAGALLTTPTILDGLTVLSQAVLGGDLGAIAAGVGTTFSSADLAVALRM